MDDLHILPKVRDSLSHLYVEHARIDKLNKSIAIHDAKGYTPVPVAALCVLMLGPGTTITHAAVQTLAENNCLVVWCGEENVRFYASGTGGTRSAAPLLLQARLASEERTRLEVVRRMYTMRFGENPDKTDTVESLRGREGVRVREAYAKLAEAHGVVWKGRNYNRTAWEEGDPLNRALSCANSCLYGLCHAALLAAGYSPGIGFIHCGKQLSFVYDIADLYKVEVTIPVAFSVAAANPPTLERAVRIACRDRFRETKLLRRIVPDIQKALNVALPESELRRILSDVAPTTDEAGDAKEGGEGPSFPLFGADNDPALPTELWTPSPETEAGYQAETMTEASAASVSVAPFATASPLTSVAVRAFSLLVADTAPSISPDDTERQEQARWNALWDDWDVEEVRRPFVAPGYRFRTPKPKPAPTRGRRWL